jgi:hypothetical protein
VDASYTASDPAPFCRLQGTMTAVVDQAGI